MLDVNNFDQLQHRPGHGRLDPHVVQRRGQEAGDHQLPHAASPRRTASSARRSSVRPRTGSATAASTSACASRASSASAAASRSPARRSAASAWATSSSAAPVVHIWYLRGTRSWLAYLLMGTEAREELKAKQLEKVIYFAANLVTWVDEETRHEDLPNLEAEMLDERDAIEKERELEHRPPLQGARGRARRARDRGRQGRRDQGPPDAPPRRTSPRIRERYEIELDLAQPRLRRVQGPASPARSSKTRCCGASCATATASTSRAAWAPTPSSR